MDQSITSAAKDLVIARLRTVPPDIELVVGNDGAFSSSDLIKKIQEEDHIGLEFVEAELEILRAWKQGGLFGEDSTFS